MPPHAAVRILLALSLSLASCRDVVVARRTGPDFDVAFPDPAALVRTDDFESTRKKLAHAKLPQTDEHHDRLLALLRAEESISPENLILLVEAVSLPEHSGTTIMAGGYHEFFAARGQGRFSSVVDMLIVEGSEKLVGLDRDSFGRLLGKTQSDAVLFQFADRHVDEMDDGSDRAVREIVEGFRSSPALVPFLTEYLAPSGRLDGELGWKALSWLSFDGERVGLIQALAARTDSCSADAFDRAVAVMSFDSGRTGAIVALESKVAQLGAADLDRVVSHFAFDAGRAEAVELLAPRLERVGGGSLTSIISHFSFDAGRTACLKALVEGASVETAPGDVAKLVALQSFDDGRFQFVERLAPTTTGATWSGRDAKAVLASFSFDSGRLSALRVLAAEWRAIPARERATLTSAFTFESGREDAAALLMD